MAGESIRPGEIILWVLGYLGVMLFYTALDVALWRKAFPKCGRALDLAAMALCLAGYFVLLKRAGRMPEVFAHISLWNIGLALACSAGFFLLLDKGLDPLLERLFPQSEKAYQAALDALRQAPVISLAQVCLLAPAAEEILMRGLVLGGLRGSIGLTGALLISSVLFAAFHFNMVQTLSALVCGLALGLLYAHTGSLFCCILAHGGYNLLSWLAMTGLFHPRS